MNTLLRSLIVWLLLLALPYQGMAAAAMFACAPGHAKPAQVQLEHQVRDAQLAPCHEAAAVAHVPAPDAQPAHADGDSCGTCAACGIGVAVLPASFPPLAAQAPPVASAVFADSCLASVHLAQPERPPRPRLA